jgi:hypothetical protein
MYINIYHDYLSTILFLSSFYFLMQNYYNFYAQLLAELKYF